MVKKNIKLRVKNIIHMIRINCVKLKINILYTDTGSIKGYFQKVLRNKYIIINEKLNERINLLYYVMN